MSYILDALRRAEAERQRGAVPGLHAQPAATAGAQAYGRAWSAPAAAGLVILVAAAAGTAWWWGRSTAPTQPAAQPAAQMTAPVAPTIAAAGTKAPTPIAPPTVAPAAAPPQVVVMVNPPPAAVPAAVNPAPAAAPASAAAPIPKLAELSAALRATLPPLVLGGIVHASAPSQRLAIIGGQVFHEGERPLPDLLVREIRPHSVVLVWRGQAFELGP